MALNPEILYPEYVTQLGDLQGGIHFNSLYVSSGDQLQAYYFSQVVTVDVSDITDANESFATAKKIRIMSFANNSILYAYVWILKNVVGTDTYKYIHGELRLENGQSVVTPPSPEFGVFNVLSGGYVYSDVTLAKTYGIKFALMTRFGGPVVENVTPAEYISIYVFCPTYDTLLPGTTQSWAAITPNAREKYEVIGGVVQDTDPEDISYPSRFLFQYSECFKYSDLDTLKTQLNTQAPIDDDDIFKKGSGSDTPTQDKDPSTPGGGKGNYDDRSDPIDFPALPTGGAISSGALKAFVISAQGLQAFFNKLWDMNLFDITTQFQKLVNEPLQCIISCHCIPCVPGVGNTEIIKLGSFDTGVNMPRVNNQYVVVDCGSITLNEYWGSALDYAPYTDLEIFLPFIGIRQIKIEDAQKSTIHVKYYVDCLTGSCVAFIKCGQSVLYSFSGNCLQHVPVTSQSSDLLKNNIAAVGMVGVGLVTGNTPGAVGGAIAGMMNTATAKNHVQRSGDIAGAAGILGEYIPYLIIHRPVQSLAADFSQFKGYPSNITYQLSTLQGYTEITYIHLTNISGATDTELTEIERLLKNGVII